MSDHYHAVIMAGGGGTRLWPLSRQARPKQVLQIVDHRTLFQVAVERLDGLFPPQRIWVVAAADQAAALQEQAPQIPVENFVLEPEPRGTASAIGLSAVNLQKRDPDAVMAVLTADHYISDVPLFQEVLAAAEEVAMDSYLVTLGIQPTYPATGYGYIQRGEKLGVYSGHNAFHVLRFKEKPEGSEAEEMIATGDHVWNSGMFIWRVGSVMEEFARQMPALHNGLLQIGNALGTPNEAEVLSRIWPTLKSETIDYGIMEAAERVVVIPTAGLGWTDVGSWASLFEVLEADEDGNVFQCSEHVNVGARNSMVHAEDSRRLFVMIGVENVVVVDTGDVLLVCSRESAQDVRKAIEELKAKDKAAYL